MEKPIKKRTIYAIIFSVMFLCLIVIAFLLLFQIRNVKVVGNKYVSDQEVIDWVQSDELATNSVYVFCKFRFTEYNLPAAIDRIKVTLNSPWSIKVQVEEKKIVGYIIVEDDFVYFDEDGIVLEKSREWWDDVACIEGLDVTSAQRYKELPVKEEEKKIFRSLLEMSEALKEKELTPDKIVCQDSELNLYFGSVCVNLGNENFAKRIAQIPPILEKLGNQKGTLHLENYGESSTTVSFEKADSSDGKKEKDDKSE